MSIRERLQAIDPEYEIIDLADFDAFLKSKEAVSEGLTHTHVVFARYLLTSFLALRPETEAYLARRAEELETEYRESLPMGDD